MENAVADVLSVMFDRWDRHPGMHEYGDTIDRRIDRLAGGGGNFDRRGPNPVVSIQGFAAKMELHETGPIVLIVPADLPSLRPLISELREMARDWAERPVGASDPPAAVSIRYGPVANTVPHQIHSWQRARLTTDPLTVSQHLDELLSFVRRIGMS